MFRAPGSTQPMPMIATASSSDGAAGLRFGADGRTAANRRADSVNSSITTCMFNPPMPNALTPARRGLPAGGSGQGVGDTGT